MQPRPVRSPRPSRLALALAGAFVILVLPACRQTTELSDLPVSTFSGRWLGKAWEGEAHAFSHTTPAGDSLYVLGFRPINAHQFPEERLGFRFLFHGVGAYALSAQDVEVLQFVGGDVVVAAYRGVGGAQAGEVHITSYDARTGYIEGSVSFDARLMGAGASEPDVHFEEGQFRATISSVP